jgi:hypothetical protein
MKFEIMFFDFQGKYYVHQMSEIVIYYPVDHLRRSCDSFLEL